jgi:hypothetical protein
VRQGECGQTEDLDQEPPGDDLQQDDSPFCRVSLQPGILPRLGGFVIRVGFASKATGTWRSRQASERSGVSQVPVALRWLRLLAASGRYAILVLGSSLVRRWPRKGERG